MPVTLQDIKEHHDYYGIATYARRTPLIIGNC